MKKIILIEDDKEYSDVISMLLTEAGYDITIENNAFEALKTIETQMFDLAIIDLDLDTLNGIQVAELINRTNPETKIMILTGSIHDEDEINALDNGVDAYVRKSVSFKVLLKRIQHIFSNEAKRKRKAKALVSKKERIKLLVEQKIVLQNSEEVHVTNLEYDLLEYFLSNKNDLLSRERILENVWKVRIGDSMVDPRIIDTYVKNIRQKLMITSIYAIRGVGYRWYEK